MVCKQGSLRMNMKLTPKEKKKGKEKKVSGKKNRYFYKKHKHITGEGANNL